APGAGSEGPSRDGRTRGSGRGCRQGGLARASARAHANDVSRKLLFEEVQLWRLRRSMRRGQQALTRTASPRSGTTDPDGTCRITRPSTTSSRTTLTSGPGTGTTIVEAARRPSCRAIDGPSQGLGGATGCPWIVEGTTYNTLSVSPRK